MINLRSPVNIFLPRIVHYLHYSTDGFSEKSFQELLKHVTNQDKIKTDEFRKLLPYLRDRDTQLNHFILANKTSNSTESESSTDESAELTNIFDKMPGATRLSVIGKSKTIVEYSSSENSSMNDPEAIAGPPKGLDVVVLADPEKTKIQPPKKREQTDLTSTLLPIALHDSDVRYNLIKAALAQEAQHIYCKATDTAQYCYARAHESGTLLYQLVRQSNGVQELARQGSVALTIWKDKTAIWLNEAPKPQPSESPSQPQKIAKVEKTDTTAVAIEKIKKTIENVVATLKQKIEERKKTGEGKK